MRNDLVIGADISPVVAQVKAVNLEEGLGEPGMT